MTHTEKKKTYGLLYPLHNKFYLVSEDYELAKWTQLIVHDYVWFSLMIMDEDDMGEHMLTSKNCKEFGVYPSLIKSLSVDMDGGSLKKNWIIPSTTGTEFFDHQWYDKVKFVYYVLSIINFHIDKVLKEYEDAFKEKSRGLEIFSEYIGLRANVDNVINSFIKVEIDQKKEAGPLIAKLKKDFYKILIDQNYNQTIDQIKESLVSQIKMMYNKDRNLWSVFWIKSVKDSTNNIIKSIETYN